MGQQLECWVIHTTLGLLWWNAQCGIKRQKNLGLSPGIESFESVLGWPKCS